MTHPSARHGSCIPASRPIRPNRPSATSYDIWAGRPPQNQKASGDGSWNRASVGPV